MYKKDEWFYHEFQLFQALEDSKPDGRFNITNGIIQTSAFEFECVPLNMNNKTISEAVEYYYSELRKISGALNYPKIHRYFEDKWLFCCKEATDKQVGEVLDELNKFVHDVGIIVHTSRVNDIYIFKE